MKKLHTLVLACAIAAPCAYAQFSVPSLGGSKASASGGSADEGAVSHQDALVRAYSAANKEVLLAQSQLAESVGLKETAARLRATSDALGDGATKGNLSEADKIQSDSSKEISARLKDDNLKMDAQSQAAYSAGMASLGRGLVRYIGMRPQINSFAQTMKAQPMLAATRLNAGAYVVTSFPSNAKNVYSTLSMAQDYAKSHDIPVPADATKALASF